MQRPNVPTATLRVFEVAARCLSFDKAAAELHISASAVSQQIARLEAKLGVALFERKHRRVVLTDAGRELSRPLTSAFRAIDRALAAVHQSAQVESIKLAIYQTWASRWLVPRLGDFTRAWPRLSVEFETGLERVDLGHSDIDFAVRWLDTREAGPATDKLFDEVLVAVCAPSVAAMLQGADGLVAVALIQSTNRPDDWSTWLAANDIPGLQARGGLKFSNTSLAIGAAVAGAGVLIGQLHLFLPELESGTLVLPYASRVETHRALYLMANTVNAAKASTEAFRSWILLEASRTIALADRLSGRGL